MEAGLARDALSLLLGLVTGILSGAFGIGGAVVSTPGVRALGASALVAIGTTLPSILPGAVAGTLRYNREGLVRWRVVAAVAPGGSVAAVVGALAAPRIPGDGHWLMVVTAGLVGFTALRLLRPGQRDRGDSQPRPERTGGSRPLALGVGAGAMSGLLGLGGGMVLLPGFIEILRLPVRAAVATSLACVGVLAVPGTITHALQGGVDWRLALLLAATVVPGAALGAAIAVRMSNRALRLAVGSALAVLAVGYGGAELAIAVRGTS